MVRLESGVVEKEFYGKISLEGTKHPFHRICSLEFSEHTFIHCTAKTQYQKFENIFLEKEFRGLTPEKSVHEFPVSSRDVTNQTPPGQE
jgi:hypothetical protein